MYDPKSKISGEPCITGSSPLDILERFSVSSSSGLNRHMVSLLALFSDRALSVHVPVIDPATMIAYHIVYIPSK